jgi:hypothetical protein
MSALKRLLPRHSTFNKISRIPVLQPWISFILAWTQLDRKHNSEMSNSVDKLLLLISGYGNRKTYPYKEMNTCYSAHD